ncbi:MAG: hypothetical protein AAGH79_09865 [Bacteroidota bacterium]
MKAYFIQIFLIVFSVVLGLFLSEQIQQNNAKKESMQLLELIKSEVQENLQMMEQVVPYHQWIYNYLDSVRQEEAFVAGFMEDKSYFAEQLFTKGSFLYRLPAQDAWDIAKSHPRIAYVPYDKLLILSKIYNQQELTFVPMFELFDLYKASDINAPDKAQQNLESLLDRIKEIVGREELLMYYFEEAKEILALDPETE